MFLKHSSRNFADLVHLGRSSETGKFAVLFPQRSWIDPKRTTGKKEVWGKYSTCACTSSCITLGLHRIRRHCRIQAQLEALKVDPCRSRHNCESQKGALGQKEVSPAESLLFPKPISTSAAKVWTPLSKDGVLCPFCHGGPSEGT